MANAEHLERLQQGVQGWNQWRLRHPKVRPDLSGATLFAAQLNGANLWGARLRKARLDRAELRGANLYKADLNGAYLPDSDLSGANLHSANLRGVRLGGAELSGANLSRAKLPESDLSEANLSGTNLSEANLSGANLSDANLSGANLSDAWLINTQVIGTKFSQAMFTGACIKGWRLTGTTILKGVICEYVYLKGFQKERRPKDRTFKPGEFATVFQQTTSTVDLVFKHGVDWRALFQALQNLRSQCPDINLSIQAIEKKRGGAFVVRVEMSPDADTTMIRRQARELYAIELQTLDTQYKQWLRSHGSPLEVARLHINMERRDKATLMGVLTTMAHSQQGPKYRMGGMPSISDFSETSRGAQNGSPGPRISKILSTDHGDPIQVKIIEMLLSGLSPATIANIMQFETDLVSYYQQQPNFQSLLWRIYFNKVLDLVRVSMTTLNKLETSPQFTPQYRLWLIRWWLKQFSIMMVDPGPPDVSVRQSEIIHLLLFGMTRRQIGDALMIDPRQISRQKRQPAFRVAFWDAYCRRLLALMVKVTDASVSLLADAQVPPHHRLIAVEWLLAKFPKDFRKTLERIEIERIACILITISTGQI
ncbi:MAG: pentapeptide repeat-containing protein [Cyanobacteria bacterium P01_F01_bin.13]